MHPGSNSPAARTCETDSGLSQGARARGKTAPARVRTRMSAACRSRTARTEPPAQPAPHHRRRKSLNRPPQQNQHRSQTEHRSEPAPVSWAQARARARARARAIGHVRSSPERSYLSRSTKGGCQGSQSTQAAAFPHAPKARASG